MTIDEATLEKMVSVLRGCRSLSKPCRTCTRAALHSLSESGFVVVPRETMETRPPLHVMRPFLDAEHYRAWNAAIGAAAGCALRRTHHEKSWAARGTATSIAEEIERLRKDVPAAAQDPEWVMVPREATNEILSEIAAAYLAGATDRLAGNPQRAVPAARQAWAALISDAQSKKAETT